MIEDEQKRPFSLGEGERLSDVKFEAGTTENSVYLKPMRMHFKRRNRRVTWELALEPDNVAVLLYHTQRKQLLFVRQFRPPLFIQTVKSLPENAGKPFDEIPWERYPVKFGESLELCAGMMDKKGKSPLEHIHEEIFEECGYRVPMDRITPISRYVVGISVSAAVQHLFYAEIDESMKVSEGGGNESESEFIEKMFMDVEEANALMEVEKVNLPPTLLLALLWWQNNKAGRNCAAN